MPTACGTPRAARHEARHPLCSRPRTQPCALRGHAGTAWARRGPAPRWWRRGRSTASDRICRRSSSPTRPARIVVLVGGVGRWCWLVVLVGFQGALSSRRGRQAALKCSHRSDSVTRGSPMALRVRTAQAKTRKGSGWTGRGLVRRRLRRFTERADCAAPVGVVLVAFAPARGVLPAHVALVGAALHRAVGLRVAAWAIRRPRATDDGDKDDAAHH